MGCELLEIERLLKRTRFKDDALEIARRIEKAGLTLDTIDDAPGKFGLRLWGHSTYSIVAAIKEAQAEKEASPKVTKKLTIEPVQPAVEEL